MAQDRREYWREYYQKNKEACKAKATRWAAMKAKDEKYREVLRAKKRLQYKRKVEAQGRTYKPHKKRRGKGEEVAHKLAEQSIKKIKDTVEFLERWTEEYNKLFTT